MGTETLKEVDARTLHGWLEDGRAVLIDVREADEYAREHIPDAHLVPLSTFSPADLPRDKEKIAVFHCRTGNRTGLAAQQFLRTGFREVYHLQGGLQAWRAAGLPVNHNEKAPISIMRQVQITAGSLVVLGIVLAVLVSPWFMALSAFVGAGLMFSGITGTCAMAALLGLMPWNRRFGAGGSRAPAKASMA